MRCVRCLPAVLPARCPACPATQPGGGRAAPGPLRHLNLSAEGTHCPTPTRHLRKIHACRRGQPNRCVCAALHSAAEPQAGDTAGAPGAGARIFRAGESLSQALHAGKTKCRCAAVGCQHACPAVGAAIGAALVTEVSPRPPTSENDPGLRRGGRAGCEEATGTRGARPGTAGGPKPPHGPVRWGWGPAGEDVFLLEKRVK